MDKINYRSRQYVISYVKGRTAVTRGIPETLTGRDQNLELNLPLNRANDWRGVERRKNWRDTTREQSAAAIDAGADHDARGVLGWRDHWPNIVLEADEVDEFSAYFYLIHIYLPLSRMICRGGFRFHVAQRRLLEARGLHMIQRPASGTLDLELCYSTHAGEKSFAFPTSAIFQHDMYLIICRLGAG